jgi:DNA recombination protein RmuC
MASPLLEIVMDTVLLILLLILVVALLAVGIVLLVLQLRKPAGAVADPLVPQTLQTLQTQTAVLAEKLAHIEQTQVAAGQGLATAADAIRADLAQARESLRAELARAREGLTALEIQARARQEVDQRSAESIRRLEAIIAGTHSKGTAGENILEFAFAKLPPEWQVRNFTVGTHVVEFAIRLPNNRILPIDSKWVGTGLLEQWAACTDPVEQQRLKEQITSVVREKAREVGKYVDPSLTLTFGVAAVPDAVYDLCTGLHAETFQQNVVLVSYSMFLPYLLLVFHTVLRTSQNLDLEKLNTYLHAAQTSIAALQEEIEGRLSRAVTMAGNSRDEMRKHLSSVSSGFAALQTATDIASAATVPLVEAAASVSSS